MAQKLDLGPAFRIAAEVHGSQVDKAGEPYLFHVCRVAAAMDTDEERVVAILHDVLEDCRDPGEKMADIFEAYGQAVLDVVAELTRNSREPYLDYIRRVAQNRLAAKVKLADLSDNRDPARLAKLAPETAARLGSRYREAAHFLRGELDCPSAEALNAVHPTRAESLEPAPPASS